MANLFLKSTSEYNLTVIHRKWKFRTLKYPQISLKTRLSKRTPCSECDFGRYRIAQYNSQQNNLSFRCCFKINIHNVVTYKAYWVYWLYKSALYLVLYLGQRSSKSRLSQMKQLAFEMHFCFSNIIISEHSTELIATSAYRLNKN